MQLKSFRTGHLLMSKAFILIFLFAVGCSKEKISVEQEALDAPQTEVLSTEQLDLLNQVSQAEGLLKFVDHDHFNEVVDLVNLNESAAQRLQDKFNFVPLTQTIMEEYKQFENSPLTTIDAQYWATEEMDGKSVLVSDYPFFRYAAVLSAQEAVMIGEVILKYSKEKVYSIQDNNRAVLNRLDAQDFNVGQYEDFFVSEVTHKEIENERSTFEGSCLTSAYYNNLWYFLRGRVTSDQWTEQVGSQYWIHRAKTDLKIIKVTLVTSPPADRYSDGTAWAEGSMTAVFTGAQNFTFAVGTLVGPPMTMPEPGVWAAELHRVGIQTQSPTAPNYLVAGTCTASGSFPKTDFEALSCTFEF